MIFSGGRYGQKASGERGYQSELKSEFKMHIRVVANRLYTKNREIAKKNSVFRSNVALNFRCRPFLLHFWKALGRARRPIPTLGVQNVKDKGAGSDQKSILTIFCRFLTYPTRVRSPTKHSLTILALFCPTRLDAQLDELSKYVGQNCVRLVGGGATSKSLVSTTLKNAFCRHYTLNFGH